MTDELRFPVEKLVYGGDGLGHANGHTVFVPYVLPGEVVRAAAIQSNKKLIRTKLVEVVTPSSGRVAPRCGHYQTCGGCHYQHIPAEEQVRVKIEILRETLSRLGGIEWNGAVTPHISPPFGYRNRAQWAVRNGPPRSMGYFLPSSAEICEIRECPVLSPRLTDVLAQLQELLRGKTLTGVVKEIEAFADSADEKVALNIAFEKFAKPAAEIAAAVRRAVPAAESLLLQDETSKKLELFGPGFLVHEVGGFRFQVNHLSFFQVNRFLAGDLLRAMTEGASGALALDLCAGVGFFSLPLARNFENVVAVDANLSAMRDLSANAESAGVKITAHAEHADEFLRRTKLKPDFVLLDPPRAGLGATAAGKLAQLGAPEMVYLSCDPATLARDLAVFLGTAKAKPAAPNSAAKYEIAEVRLFDLFPQTFHLETLVRLRRVP